MANFEFEALDSTGKRTSGKIEARTRLEALAVLEGRRLQPVVLSETEERSAKGESPRAERRVSNESISLKHTDIIRFTEELADLLDAGLQLEGALKSMEQRSGRPLLSKAVTKVRSLIRDGMRFSEALKQTSPSFGELYCSMMAAGELSGSLPEILRRQQGLLTTLNDLRSKMIQALIYPAFIFGAGIILLFIFMSVLVPQLSVVFEKTGGHLPLPTRVLLALTTLFFKYWWLLLLGLVTGCLIFWRTITTPSGRLWWHHFQLKIPLVGEILRCQFYALMGHTIANLTANGLPLLAGLELMSRSVPNIYLRRQLERISSRVGEGGSLAKALAKFGPFPDLMIDLVSVGELTGAIPSAFQKIGCRYDKLMEVRIQRLTALIQPVIICMMAFVVGVVAYSILGGIFQAVASLKTR